MAANGSIKKGPYLMNYTGSISTVKVSEGRPLLICGIAGENRPTGAKFPMEIIDL